MCSFFQKKKKRSLLAIANEKQDFLIVCSLTMMIMEAISILKSNPLHDEKNSVEEYSFVNEKQLMFIKKTS